jgi:hypothetical protein
VFSTAGLGFTIYVSVFEIAEQGTPFNVNVAILRNNNVTVVVGALTLIGLN